MIENVLMSSLDYSDSFFDSFRGFYPKFDDWFSCQSRMGRHAYIHRDSEGSLDGFLCLKIEGTVEDYSDLEKPFELGVRLKICSLKSIAHGIGLGCTFIQMALDVASITKVDGVYVTVFAGTPETDKLIRRLVDFGFIYRCLKGGECVYECSVFH